MVGSMPRTGGQSIRLIETQQDFGFLIAIPMRVPANPIGICNCCQDVRGKEPAPETSGFFVFVVMMLLIRISYGNASVLNS